MCVIVLYWKMLFIFSSKIIVWGKISGVEYINFKIFVYWKIVKLKDDYVLEELFVLNIICKVFF